MGSRDDHGMSLVLEACRRAGVAPAFLEHECKDDGSMLALVRIEGGVALVPRRATLGRTDDVAMAPLHWPPPRRRLLAASQLREHAQEHAREVLLRERVRLPCQQLVLRLGHAGGRAWRGPAPTRPGSPPRR